jgi:thymidylate synthase (FAD)|tara:strand:+ start:5940 stop:6560 length:621 start_codon:yes stop_codon:yes gene_type:complete
MKVSLISTTPNAEENIVYIARVSSKREDKKSKPEGLLNYLIKHKHWSPFEHSYMSVEIETSKAIGIQLIRHRSFTFQEFSQRYQNVELLGEMFEEIEFRKQCKDNRQSSTEVLKESHPEVKVLLLDIKRMYQGLIEDGVARETARMILPLCTKTKIHMTGSLRSWIHFLELRDDEHAQKEIQLIAKEIKRIFKKEFPVISNALKYE